MFISGSITEQPHCYRDLDNQEMDVSSCAQNNKPTPKIYECVLSECESKYYWTASYGQCVAKCGSGNSLRLTTEYIGRGGWIFLDNPISLLYLFLVLQPIRHNDVF